LRTSLRLKDAQVYRFKRIRYIFPGAESVYHPRLRQDMVELIALDLEPQFKSLASKVGIVFQNKPRIPF